MLQDSSQNLQKREKQVQQSTRNVVNKIRTWLNLEPYEMLLKSHVQEYQLDLYCQYTKKPIVRPAKTLKCQQNCIIQYSSLSQIQQCPCGLQVSVQNPIVQDYLLQQIVELIHQSFGSKVKRVKVNMKQCVVEPF